ncbi:ATP-dependent RNA helicase SrmB [Aestuariibacter salexigens]|uniref:ATP-dependent RNA helicase SrmB n=1 Tax=Aestuariibacter salexigens TaxID=226010 RepID=UPI0004051172|nr:ATP-dependent RNA helicase SrmB [Aestuariibacter salexigens]
MFDSLDLDAKLTRALADMGYKKPTGIQQEAIPVALEGRDVLAQAPTGTGKTAAFLLPAAQYLLDYPRRDPGSARVIILTPTRELALQVYEQAKAITAHTDLTCGVITGGINYGTDKETLSKSLDILVATPGRLFEHIEKESFSCQEIEVLILDEADRMLDMGFANIVHQISAEARWRKQSMLFSATLEGSGINTFARDILKDPVPVSASATRKEQGKIIQYVHLADDYEHKLALLIHLLNEPEQRTIVFVKTRERLATLKQSLQSHDIPVCWLQGEMPQDKRIAALARFKSGEVPILLATDVAARGIDVEKITHVINFDLPRTADVYVHRIGRTGRAGNKGTAISLVEAHDMVVLGKIERYISQPLKRRVIDGLRPKHKEAKVGKKVKKKKASTSAKKPAKKAKQRRSQKD